MTNIILPRSVLEQALKAWAQARGALAYVAVGNAPSNPNLARSTCSQAVWVLDTAEPALIAALEQPQVEQEPVAWQRRMRTKWMQDGEWWPWQECSKEVAADYKRAPAVGDWEYESRPLYTHPQPTSRPLTHQQREAMWHEAKLLARSTTLPFEWYCRGISDAEAAHGIKEQK